MPRASATDAAETARRILEAARAHFVTAGFAAASVDDIARDASVTRGAVYHHYGSKIGLFRTVVDAMQGEVAGKVVAAADAQGDAATGLRVGSHTFLDAITGADAARVLLVDAPAVIGWAEWRRVDADNSARHLREGLAATKGVAPSLVPAMTQLLSGAMNDAALWILENEGDAGVTRAAHRALDRLLDAVTQPAA